MQIKITFELDQSSVVAHYLRKLFGSNAPEDINDLCKMAVFYAVGDGAKLEGEEINGAAKEFADIVARLASLTPAQPELANPWGLDDAEMQEGEWVGDEGAR